VNTKDIFERVFLQNEVLTIQLDSAKELSNLRSALSVYRSRLLSTLSSIGDDSFSSLSLVTKWDSKTRVATLSTSAEQRKKKSYVVLNTSESHDPST